MKKNTIPALEKLYNDLIPILDGLTPESFREVSTDKKADEKVFNDLMPYLKKLDPDTYFDVIEDMESGRHDYPDGTYAYRFSLPDILRTLQTALKFYRGA